MSLTAHAIEKNRVTLVALLVILALGISAYNSLPRNEDPGFIVRTALVSTVFPGASPERVELLVTDKLEKAIQEIPELDSVVSESKTGVSLIYVNIQESYTNMRPIWDNLRRKVERARSELPESVIGPSVDDEFGDVFGIIIGITGGPAVGAGPADFDYRELKQIADEVRDELLLIQEVAKVVIKGAQEERVFVEYSNARLSDLGLSPGQLQSILKAQNIIIPGGEVRTDFEEIVLEPSGNFLSVEEIARVVIRIPGQSGVIYLGDIADRIYRGYIDPPKTWMRTSGTPSLGLSISMREGGNMIRLGEEVREVLARMEAAYPIGIDFEVIQFQPDAVDKKIKDFAGNLLQSVLIVTLVMLLTLGLRTGLVVASLIPMAMVASFAVMKIFNVGLDQMSIAALIIALGMLVDNAIVMSESIMVQMAAGRKAVDAAVDSAAELKVPLLTSSLTTAAAFLPIFLAESSTGEYTAPLFKVVTITLLCSWALSLTMIPLLCATFLRVKVGDDEDTFDSKFYRAFRAVLLTGLRRPWLSLAAVVAIFIASLSGFKAIPNIFFPPNDRPTFTASLELPIGTPATRTAEVVNGIENFVHEQMLAKDGGEGVTNWASFIGEGAPRFILPYSPQPSRPEYAFLLLNASSRAAVDDLVGPLENFAQEHYPDIKATVRPLDLGPPAWPPIEVRISGRDADRLFEIVDKVKAKLHGIQGTKLIDDNWGARSKKLLVRVDQPRAQRAGVTSQDVAISLSTYLSGLTATEFREDDELIPVVLRSGGNAEQDLELIETLNVYAQATGENVPLKQVADVQVVWQPATVRRYDRLKTVTIEAGLRPGLTATEVNAQLVEWLDAEQATWGPGYAWELGGEAETSGTAQESIGAKLPVAGLIILLLLVTQFNSLRRPAIILLTIPLSLIGVVIGLLVARSYFGFMTLLGVISLAGIVINNAIVLLDRIRIEIDDNGLKPADAVVESVQRRLRPILLTTFTTVGGLIPLWLGGGAMFEPMAIAIIFGLVFATGLTLGVVPILYSLMFRVDFRGS